MNGSKSIVILPRSRDGPRAVSGVRSFKRLVHSDVCEHQAERVDRYRRVGDLVSDYEREVSNAGLVGMLLAVAGRVVDAVEFDGCAERRVLQFIQDDVLHLN